MKKTLLALGLVLALLVPSQRAMALIGFGLNAGQDSYSISGESYTNLFGISGITLTREDFDKPFGIGGYLFIDAIPIIDVEVGFDLYGRDYTFTYVNDLTGDSEPQDFAWLRTTGYLSIQKNVFKLPVIKFYVGGGLNFNASLPIVDKDFIEEFLGDENTALDIDDLLEASESNSGVHFELGARMKPPLIPIALNVRFRQTMVEGIVPGKKAFATISAGIGFQL
ncbi:MAG: hypothetical protein ACETWG_05025 [Candidatus Neomarinimicrobiota bacterium]